MGGDEIDAGKWRAARPPEYVAASCESGGEGASAAHIPAPEAAGDIAVPTVPLGPAGWESSQMVAVRRVQVPRLRDQLGTLQDRVLPDGLKKRGSWVKAVPVPTQRRGQIEAKAVHSHH